MVKRLLTLMGGQFSAIALPLPKRLLPAMLPLPMQENPL